MANMTLMDNLAKTMMMFRVADGTRGEHILGSEKHGEHILDIGNTWKLARGGARQLKAHGAAGSSLGEPGRPVCSPQGGTEHTCSGKPLLVLK